MPNATTQPSLWDFALIFYAKPQVAEICIDLQDTYNCNVCLLIGLGWLDEQGEILSIAALEKLESHIQFWTQQIVEPLRGMRRLLKQPLVDYALDDTQMELRTLIKKAELLAEKKLLAEIELWLTKFPTKAKLNNGSNVKHYLQALAVPTTTIELMRDKFSAK